MRRTGGNTAPVSPPQCRKSHITTDSQRSTAILPAPIQYMRCSIINPQRSPGFDGRYDHWPGIIVQLDVRRKWEETDMNTSEELARFKDEVRQMVRHMRLSEEGSFQVVQHGDWGYSVRRRTAPLVTLLGESEPWEAELAAFENTHQDWLAWISAVPADALTQELVNP